MIVRKVFRQDDSGRELIEAALKKFFYPRCPVPDEQQTVPRPQGYTTVKNTGKESQKT